MLWSCFVAPASLHLTKRLAQTYHSQEYGVPIIATHTDILLARPRPYGRRASSCCGPSLQSICYIQSVEAQIVTAEFSDSLENDTAIVSEGMLEWCDVWAFGVS